TLPASGLKTDGNGFFNTELPLGNLAFDAEGKPCQKFTVKIVASDRTPNPGLNYMRLTRDYKPAE
ncbi:MAG: hypothetical protein J6U31_08185, partial [Bacteroidales bacterium]|nr:hypothetical protein [Bacteroidales bacterium]